MAKNCQQVGGAKGKANAGNIFLYQFLGIEQRSAAVAGIDGRVGLNPDAGPGSIEAASRR